MTMHFRNLDFDPTAPMDRWPAEAIETVIDRGSLSDWRRLADAIRRNPWGPAARTTETVVSWDEHYGVDALMSDVIRHAREDLDPAGTDGVRRADSRLADRDRHDAPPVRPRRRHLGIPAVRLREREGRPHHRRARPPQPRRGNTHATRDSCLTASVSGSFSALPQRRRLR